MDMSKYREMFLTESRDHLLDMGRLLLALEQDPTERSAIDALFRNAHSIKGMAASMGFEGTTELAHYLEDLLEQCRRNGQVPPEVGQRLLEGVDLLEGLLDDLTADGPEWCVTPFLAHGAPAEISSTPVAKPTASPPELSGEPIRTVRIRTELLDRLLDLAGALLTNRYRLQSAAKAADPPRLLEGIDHLSRLVTDLHHQVLQARMLPMGDLTGRLPRLVRELAQHCGKTVSLRIEGEGVEIDRTTLEGLAEPLMHLLRNAVDHGIEQQGEIVVRASRDKDQVVLSVSDNGRGLDPVTIREQAVRSGLLSPEQASTLRQRELLLLICAPGFSTAKRITDTSGRGVGMDVVKTTVEQLGGTLEIASTVGVGTCFTLRLPVSVAIIQVLLVTCAGQTLAIPASRVQRTLEIPPAQLHRKSNQVLATIRDGVGAEAVETLVPLLSLRKVLGLPTTTAGNASVSIVVTEARGRRVGLVVDALAGQREVFVKNLTPPLNRLPGISGSTILGDGRIIFLLDPPYLLEDRPAPVAATNPVSAP
jgi:two-component system, chemotaxis family, sensor kinase CheA